MDSDAYVRSYVKQKCLKIQSKKTIKLQVF